MRAAVVAGALFAAACSPSTSGHGAASSPAGSTTPAPPTSASSAPPPMSSPAPSSSGSTGPKSFRVIDVTFVGDQGWALGRGALAHSTDDGLSWSRMRPPPPHVHHLRFATAEVGYAFSRQALYLTTDGGRSWQRQPGGADQLETLNGNVVRIVDHGGCPPGCTYAVELAPIGGTSWQRVSLPGSQGPGDGVQLVRTGGLSALETYGNPAGGAGSALATLYTSNDNGASWVRRGEPCPQGDPASMADGEVDSSALTSADDGSLTVLCTPRGQLRWQFTTTSTDGGATFHAGNRRALGSAGVSAIGAASASIVLVSSDLTYRSADGGRHFAKVAGPARWIGFASASVGHAISLDGRAIWTTTDGGRSWRTASVP